jgi:hypothetical protein
MHTRTLLIAAILALGLNGCSKDNASNQVDPVYKAVINSEARFDIYKSVPLTANIEHLSKNQRAMLREMFAAARIMDQLFWLQSFGNPDYLIPYVQGEKAAQFALVNYGPWDRLSNNQPFLEGFGEKPLGAKFYPADMTKEEFEVWEDPDKAGLYSIVTRREDGSLMLTPYSKAYGPPLNRAAEHLRKASQLADDPVFAEYLALRATALLDDNYQPSDLRWMDMTNNTIDFVVGPIETYEDSLFGYRAAFEAYILIKDLAWSEKLNRFVQYLPELQRNLPVPEQYKQETVGGNSQLNAYDVVYYAGRANAGSKTIAINLPNDEEVQLSKGTRRLQLKNAMQAKFDHILLPIADLLIDPSQRQHITFDAFFANTMFHEVAHGLGIKKTIESGSNVRTVLQETASAIEEGKADILGLYMVTQLHAKGELGDVALEDFYVTFMASIFRSVRFGAASAHGKANMIRFNYFLENGAFVRDEESGTYRVDMKGMRDAMANLSRLILTIQGDGDLTAAQRLLADRGNIGEQLAADLAQLANANIPVDVSFVQGETQLGL